jgi:hypothetical protein
MEGRVHDDTAGSMAPRVDGRRRMLESEGYRCLREVGRSLPRSIRQAVPGFILGTDTTSQRICSSGETMTEYAYVTQEMWDHAQEALRAALPIIEQHTPPLSTAGTMVSIRDQVRAAIIGPVTVGERTP